MSNKLVLTPEQASLLSQTPGRLLIYLPDGSIAGYLSDRPVFTAEEIAAAERAAESPGPWYTTQQVLDHLRTFDTVTWATDARGNLGLL
jgi:hypothetical protein